MPGRRALLGGAALAAAGAAVGGVARGDAIRRRVTMLVGAPAGSGADAVARAFAGFLGARMDGSFPGGAEVGARNLKHDSGREMLAALGEAPPTGATIGWVGTPMIPARMIDRSDPGLLDRIQLLGQVEREPVAFVSLASDPARTVQDIVQRAADDVDAVPLATPPAGSPPHLAVLRLQVLAQTRLNIVTFPSPAAARQALLAGNVSAAALALSEVIEAVRDGTLSALGIAARRRFGLLPDTPVLDEAGIPLSAFIRRGIAVPAGTPPEVSAALVAAMRAVTEDPVFKEQAEAGGYYAAWADGPAWMQQLQAERAVLAKLWETDPWPVSSGG